MIRLKNITKTYVAGDTVVKALSDVSITFREKEFVSILGPSGCGKTTLLNILGGLDRYDCGDICVNNISTKNYKDKDWDAYRNHYIGFVFQNYNLIPHLNVVENVELALSIGGTSKKEKRQKALDALNQVGLLNQAKKRPNQLSGGQMQRVAIARALVNNPEIILADEPTGALDSETSVQVMDILKEISKKHLVIMVTHNNELADKYSTRIIKLLDGKMVDDSNPYNPKEKANQENKKNKSAMSLLTAFALSFKNLFTKKAKTLLVSFAGSIGIIGIALVLAVSTGMTGYVNSIQSEALGNYPITVSAISVDMDKFGSMEIGTNQEETIDQDVVVPYKPFAQYITYGHYNNLSSSFVQHVKEFEQEDINAGGEKLSVVDYNYYIPIKMLTKDASGNVQFVKRANATSILSGGSSSAVYPMLNNMDYVMEQYDLIYGELPKVNAGEEYSKDMLLVVGGGNKISDDTLKSIGIIPQANLTGAYENISFQDIVGKEYKLLFNDDYYTPNSANFDEITEFAKLDQSNQTKMQEKYNQSTTTLKISGVIRLKEDASSELLTAGLVYMRDLENYYAQNCQDSLIARKQIANKSSYKFYDNYIVSIAELLAYGLLPVDGYSSVEEINGFLNAQYGYMLSADEAFELGIQQIGISSMPVSIRIFPKNFDAKDSIIEMIEEYNNNQTNENLKIVYSDTAGFLTSTLGQIVNIISYVLIAFAGISLVVSSIMIGIITYTSVIERTKEIGVLRSLGARKKDISRVFNMETFIIGLTAGLMGVLITFALTFPISGIFMALGQGAITTNLAVLRVDHMVILTLISVVLTLIAGLVPAKIASKKDPVKALRTE